MPARLQTFLHMILAQAVPERGITELLLQSWILWLPFFLWQLIDCFYAEPDRYLWMLIILLVNPGFPAGAGLYFALRWLPRHRARWIGKPSRWTKQAELSRLEAAALQIGNAHQYVQWADLLREVKAWKQARTAYQAALEREPGSLPALWGLAQVELATRRFAEARRALEPIMAADSAYKFGDASLAYGRALMELKDRDAARLHWAAHVKRWRQPEAVVRHAELLAEAGDSAEALRQLDLLLIDARIAPSFFHREHGRWIRRARSLRRRLG